MLCVTIWKKRSQFKKAGRFSMCGQIMVEYALMFSIIVIVLVYAGVNYIQPAVNGFFRTTSQVINGATGAVANAAP